MQRCKGNKSDNDQWQDVIGRKQRRRRNQQQVMTGTGSTDNQLETVERSRKIHICFLKPNTTPEALVAYMNKKSPSDDYTAQKLKLKHEYYSSFAITLPESKYDFFMVADV
ncbi:hypothetical protein O0L34_g19411 [Tuta absoluta]|nr:hypothetical protein O0L34_g19411 [Tuta absoluta]